MFLSQQCRRKQQQQDYKPIELLHDGLLNLR
jgi:hypothetical protein